MRDVKRIHKFCNELATFWEAYVPDLRFWQVLSVIADGLERDPFFLEENEWSALIHQAEEKLEEWNAAR